MSRGLLWLAAAIFLLCAILIVIGLAAFIVYRNVKRKVQSFSRQTFGTDDIMKGLEKVDKEAEITPKSVSSATSICLPKIMKDFPEFHYGEMKSRAENLIVSYLTAIDTENASALIDGTTSELEEKLEMKLHGLQNINMKERYKDIKVHKTEIKNYYKEKGRCCVQFQTAIQYYYYREKDGKITEGSKDRMKQSKYETEMIYIQDRDYIENQNDSGLAMNCPNCGAPLPKLGAKKCLYCDTPITEFSIKIWNFSDVKEV